MNEIRSDGGIENVEHDRISSLPDEVLTHILSFLSTKEAVHTCVLSRRWINTWATVPVLNFNLYEFMSDVVKGDRDPGREREKRKSVARFEQFVHGVLDNHESTTLDIVSYMRQIQSSEAFNPMEWLDRVALLMPRVIHFFISRVDFKRGNGVDLPDSVFSNARLQRLKMGLSTNGRTPTIIRPASIVLPSLKVLELSYVELPNDFTQKLFMGCPSLERLDLHFCELYFSSISSNVLKKLTILHCSQLEHMQISCPGLVSLFIDSNFHGGGNGISLKKAIALVNATIKLFWWGRFIGGHDVPVLDLFSGLSSTTELALYFASDLMESVEKDVSNCRNFKNLKKLRIEMRDTRCDFYFIACLLKCSPNLNELNLLVIVRGDKIQEEPRREILGDAFFRHEYLETVNISVRGMSKLPSECVKTLIKTLDKYVKKIGNIIIT